MNFGTGGKVYEKDEGVLLDSELLPAAVKCWFTVQGKGMPLSMKIQNEDGQIQTIGPIFTDTFQKLRYEAFHFGNTSAGSVRKEEKNPSVCIFIRKRGSGEWGNKTFPLNLSKSEAAVAVYSRLIIGFMIQFCQ